LGKDRFFRVFASGGRLPSRDDFHKVITDCGGIGLLKKKILLTLGVSISSLVMTVGTICQVSIWRCVFGRGE